MNDRDDPNMFLADDGSGSDISIPAILITRSDGETLIEYYTKISTSFSLIKKVKLEIKFDIERKDNTVNYDIYYTPDQINIYQFLEDFQKYQIYLGKLANLNIHIITSPHYSYSPEVNRAYDNCFGSGLYCTRPGKLGITDSSKILLEAIRQKCIFMDSKRKEGSIFNYWKYMSKFRYACIDDLKFNSNCAENVMDYVGIDSKAINVCIMNSFGADKEETGTEFMKTKKNSILDEDYEYRKSKFITRSPTLTINNVVYMGSWRGIYVFEALCGSLINKPSICYMDSVGKNEAKGFSFFSLFMIVLIVLIINIAIFIMCKNIIKKKIMERSDSADINSKIDTVVNSYMALRDKK